MLTSGDDTACKEFSELVPHAVTMPVKWALGQNAADTLHPGEARNRLRQGAAQALRLHADAPPTSVPEAMDVEAHLHQPPAADPAALILGVSRDGRTLAFKARRWRPLTGSSN